MTTIIVAADGEERAIDAPDGLSLMEVLRKQGYAAVKGECGGSMSCATCHVVVDAGWFDALPAISEDEEAALDCAFDLTPTSRLSCQIVIAPRLEGLRVSLP